MGGEETRARIERFVRDVLRDADLPSDIRADVREDFVAHLEEAVEVGIRRGLDPTTAVEHAIRDFGRPDELRTRLRAFGRSATPPLRPAASPSWRERTESVLQDLRVAIRSTGKRPLVPGVVVLTVAVGIAATTTVYSVVEKVLLEPLPFPESEELVVLANEAGDFGVTSPANFLDIRDQTSGVLSGLAVYTPTTVVATVGTSVERVDTYLVSADFVDVLGVAPAVGRGFDPVHETGDEPVALVSHDFWMRELGGDPASIPASVTFDGVPTQVIGVMPVGYRLHGAVDVWLPLTLIPGEASRGSNYLFAVGRLAAGHDVETVQAAVDVVAARLHEAYPRFFGDGPLPIRSLHRTMVSGVSSRLQLTALAVLLVMLLVCGNVGTLLFARVEEGRAELAVRRSMGAPASRIVQLLLVDAGLLIGLGAGVGLLLTWQAIDTLRELAPRGLPRADELSLGVGVFAVGIVMTVVAALVVTGPVLWRALRSERAGNGVGGSPTRVTGRVGWRRALVVGQVAGSVVLMVYAGLLVRSFSSLRSVDPGLEAGGVLTAQVALNGPSFADPSGRWQYFQALRERLEGEPGVAAVAVGTFRPTSGGFTRRFALSDRPPPPDDAYLFATFDPVAPGYFETLGIPRVAGRTFEAADASDERGVAVVNEAFADAYFQGASPVGTWLGFYVNGEPRSDQLEIIGVVGDVRADALASEARPAIYLPLSISPMTSGTVFVRARGEDPTLARRVRQAFLDVDVTQPAYSVQPMSEVYAASIERDRLLTLLLSTFAAIAIVLATSGIFGLTAHNVGRRTREFGLRIALGANPSGIVRTTLWRGVTTASVGIAVGTMVAWLSSSLVRDALFDVHPGHVPTYAGAVLVLFVVTAAAVSIPARKASTIHPMEALRHD